MPLRKYQSDLLQAVRDLLAKYDAVMMQLATGGGKCLGRGTPVLMYDGTTKPVERVSEGDKLMGPDSNPRAVLSICRGKEMLYRVTPVKGDPYIVNESHILSLKRTGQASKPQYPCQRRKGEIVNISVREYIATTKNFKHIHKGWRSGVDFEHNELLPAELPPYMLGLWLGDGTSGGSEITTADHEIAEYIESFCDDRGANLRIAEQANNNKSRLYTISTAWQRKGSMLSALRKYRLIKNKHIPHEYKTASRENRLELLAGLMDSDGHLHRSGYDYISKLKTLSDDIAYVARSLGLAAYVSKSIKKCGNNGAVGTYWRISITGGCDEIPVKIARKKAPPRKQIKSHLVTGIKVEPIGQGEYFGFEIDGDRLFMLGDFTVTHNTWIFSVMTALALAKNNPVWIVVPRNELLMQSSDQLASQKTPHGVISAKSSESRAFNVHVVSKDTLIRRIKAGKVKNWPKLIIIDEAHLALDQQLFIRDNAPEGTKFIGVTATPEKLDGRGLSEMYQDIAYGPSPRELVEMGFLTDVRYFCPPGFDFKALNSSDFSGTEIKQDVLDQILKSRQIYGNAISHYTRYGQGKSTIVFCRSVKAAEETAQRFRDSGYVFESIDGKMTDKKRKALIEGLRTGRVQGLTSCELICYGLDVPRVECIIMLRPTLSRTLFFQMIGRGLRPYIGEDGTIKEHCIILDHVCNLKEHGHPLEPYQWKFHGKDKRGREKGEAIASLKICPECFMYYYGTSCDNCGAVRGAKNDKKYQEIDGRLIEIKGPVAFFDREGSERRQIQEKIDNLIEKLKVEMSDSGLAELLKQAEERGWNAMKIYWELSAGMMAVNVPLLHSIQRIRGYKTGWVWMQTRTIEKRLGR